MSRTVGDGGPLPDWYLPLAQWGSMLLFGYVLLASVGLIAYGGAILESGVFPSWSAWVVVGMGAVFIVTLVIFRNTVPLLPHLGTGLLGVLAVLKAWFG